MPSIEGLGPAMKIHKTKNNLDHQFAELFDEWESSKQREALIDLIKRKIIPNERIQIQSALCLGLGSIENAKRERLPSGAAKPIDGPRASNATVLQHWEPFADDDRCKLTKPICHGRPQNPSLYQLIVFETILDCLRERFNIEHIRFQDPKFTHQDQKFLEQRGYTVVPYPTNKNNKTKHSKQRKPCDPYILECISSSTWLFAPGLDLPVIVEAVCAGQPSLYFGENLLTRLTMPHFVVLKGHPAALVEEFKNFTVSRDFEEAQWIYGEDCGFMWPVDLEDERVMGLIQDRWMDADQAEAEYEPWMANIRAAKRKKWRLVGAEASGKTRST